MAASGKRFADGQVTPDVGTLWEASARKLLLRTVGSTVIKTDWSTRLRGDISKGNCTHGMVEEVAVL